MANLIPKYTLINNETAEIVDASKYFFLKPESDPVAMEALRHYAMIVACYDQELAWGIIGHYLIPPPEGLDWQTWFARNLNKEGP